MSQLVKLEGAVRALAEARTLDEIKQVHDIATAAAEYARAAKLGLEAQNYAAEVKLRAERKAGELLAGLPKEQGGATRFGISNVGNTVSDYRAVLDETETSYQQANRWQKIATIPAEKFEAFVEQTKAAGDELTTTAALRVANGAHVSHNSGQNEWYTPVEYIEAARAVMGGIDLDPASSEIANKTVQAATYYTAEDDGLSRTWSGRVWMNPPYSQPLIGLFCKALRDEVERGNVSEAITLTNNATETAWFSDLLEVASAICLIRGRVRFVDPDGKPSGAPLQGQIVTYAGGRPDEFIDVFSRFGRGLYVSTGNNPQRG